MNHEFHKVLFVTYGGSHVLRLLPVIDEFIQHGIEPMVIGLTTAGSVLRGKNISYFGYKDFVQLFDSRYKVYGQELLGKHHNSIVGVEIDESLAYLGINFLEMVEDFGLNNAREQFESVGRAGFSPMRAMKRIVKTLAPDVVIATDSPRSEFAALCAAKDMGIPTVSVVDLFGIGNLCPLVADKLCVFSEITKTVLLEKGHCSDQILVTGNPMYDIKGRDPGPEELVSLRMQLGCSERSTVCLYAEQYGLLMNSGAIYNRTREDIFESVRLIFNAIKEMPEIHIVVRFHPSQGMIDLDSLIPGFNSLKNQRLFAALPLRTMLMLSDVVLTRTSTVAVEGLLLGCSVIQLLDMDYVNLLKPLVDSNLIHQARSSSEVTTFLNASHSRHFGESPLRSCPGLFGEGQAAKQIYLEVSKMVIN